MPPSQSAEIAVIIVNYGTAALALEAVQSVLARNHGGRTVEVHLIDNASPSDDAEVLAREIAAQRWEQSVTFHPEAQNHGFGCANNLVLDLLTARATPPTYVFLLNPDAQLENEAIAILADFLDAHPTAAAAGARIRKPGGSTVTAAFRFPSVISTFSESLSFGPVSRALRHWQVPLSSNMPTARVGWVAGAAVLLRFSAAQAVGFFDPAYFLYYEEVDLMRCITAQGGEIWHVSEANVMHAEGTATGVMSGRAARSRYPAYWYHSWQHYFLKNHGRAGALTAAAAWALGASGNRVLGLLRNRPAAAPLHFFGDFWAMAVRPLIGLQALPYD